MKQKKLLLPIIFLLSAVLAIAAFAVVDGIAEKPVITEHEFPFSITCELQGDVIVLDDTVVCVHTGIGGFADPKARYYDGWLLSDEEESPQSLVIYRDDRGEISIITKLYPDHLMGDPMYDYFDDELWEPLLVYSSFDGQDYAEGRELPGYQAKILSWEYPEPLVNGFAFSHIARLSGNSVLPMTLIALLALLACLIFVKKEQDLVYRPIDKVSIVFNFAIAVFVFPIVTVTYMLYDITGAGEALADQIGYCLPALTVLCLTASVCLRRKGYRKQGFYVQFVSVALFALIFVIEFFKMF